MIEYYFDIQKPENIIKSAIVFAGKEPYILKIPTIDIER